MSTATELRPVATQPGLSENDRLAHDLASYVRRPLMAEHDRTKEPLPPRPRGPHPYLVEAA